METMSVTPAKRPLLFHQCDISKRFWNELESYLIRNVNLHYSFHLKYICSLNGSENGAIVFLINFIILYTKFFIHIICHFKTNLY